MQDSQRWSFSCGPQSPRFAQYLAAVQQLDQLAQNRFGKHVVSAGDLLDDRSRHHYRALGRAPSQPTGASRGGSRLAARCRAKSEIDRILRESVSDPVGPEFMAPASRRGHGTTGRGRQLKSEAFVPNFLECKRRAVTVEIPMSFANSALDDA